MQEKNQNNTRKKTKKIVKILPFLEATDKVRRDVLCWLATETRFMEMTECAIKNDLSDFFNDINRLPQKHVCHLAGDLRFMEMTNLDKAETEN